MVEKEETDIGKSPVRTLVWMAVSLGLLGVTEYYVGLKAILEIFGLVFLKAVDIVLVIFILLIAVGIVKSSAPRSQPTASNVKRPITPRKSSTSSVGGEIGVAGENKGSNQIEGPFEAER